MPINWFPGHMNKARRELRAALRTTDVVLEVLDARVPQSSQNPMLAALRGDLPALRVLAHADRANPESTRAWLATLCAEPNVHALAIDARRSAETKPIPKLCHGLARGRGTSVRKTRIIIVGIPNVGKSTVLNSLMGRKVADVRNEPAVTRRQAQFELSRDVIVMDTPGVLWPKLEDQTAAHKLAMLGAVRDTAMDNEEVARFALEWLTRNAPLALAARYGLESAVLDDRAADPLEFIARRRGCVRRGGEVDADKASELLLREFRDGTLGRFTLDSPPEPGE